MIVIWLAFRALRFDPDVVTFARHDALLGWVVALVLLDTIVSMTTITTQRIVIQELQRKCISFIANN